MQDAKHKILVWLPSPMGDAILSVPALRAIRQHFASSQISFLAKPVVREVLSPSSFNNTWLEPTSKDPFKIAKMLQPHRFTIAILLKNSFASALAVLLARIPSRIGYVREGRFLFLTDKLYPPRLPGRRFKPISMIDYYLAVPSWLGADTSNKSLELSVDPPDEQQAQAKLPEVFLCKGPIVVLVPGGAFGPSKCWPSDRFAQIADWLVEKCNATVVISVASDPAERQIAGEISNFSKHKLISLEQTPINLGQLKALFAKADLIISNDTGPRHIAIALRRKVITLFGPNDPAWTDTGYENEIQIVGRAPCAPCAKPVCKEPEHLCMRAIPVDMVFDAATKLLENQQTERFIRTGSGLAQISEHLCVATDYEAAFRKIGLTSIDSVFSFNAGKNLSKNNLATYRSRLQFEISAPAGPTTAFLKRYDSPPITAQLKNWIAARARVSCAFCDFEAAVRLSAAGVSTPRTIAYGEQRGTFLEKRSFIITEKIPNAESLERKLPDYFERRPTSENLKFRRAFIARLASFIRRFHDTDYRHRDLYASHIFCGDNDKFYLIDLTRAFKPALFTARFRRKDIAQIHYSAPAKYFSNTDRLRFYLGYAGRRRLTKADKEFIRKVINKAKKMARHNIKHGRPVPFQG